MKINELREKRAAAVKQMREYLERAETDKRDMNDEEKTAYDKAFADVESLRVKIEQEERQIELEREMASQAASKEDQKRKKDPDPDDPAAIHQRAFSKYCSRGVGALTADEVRALENTDDSAGGYLKPDEQFVASLIKAIDDMVFIRSRATVYQVRNADSLGVPSLENDPADSDWTTELLTGSEDSTMDFGKRKLTPNPIAKLIKVSNTLLQRSVIPAESLVRDRLAYKFAISMEKAFLTGTGASQPLGVFTASSDGISTSRDVSTGNSTSAMTFDGLINTKYSLKGQYWSQADWMFHRDGLKQITKLKDGDGQYLWRQSVREGEPDSLLGRPVMMSEYAPNTFTTGLYVGMLGDFSQYWIADALSLGVQRLVELYAATNQVGFIGRLESDGMPVLEEAFARVKLA